MPAWQQITADVVESRTVAPLFDALRTAATGTIDDRFYSVRDNIVQQIRAAVESRPSNQADQDVTLVPPELINCACWLILEELIAALPDGAVTLTDVQKSVIQRHHDLLEKVRSGDFRVSKPLNPLLVPDVQANGGVQVASERTRIFTRDNIAGL
jgi:hypothetical protein